MVGFVIAWRPAQAPDATSLQDRVAAIAAQLRAPADHNAMTVANSPIPQAEHMRYQIQEDLLRGLTRQQTIQSMVRQYGAAVLAAPQSRGFGIWVWLMPGTMLILGGWLFFGTLRGTTRFGARRPQAQETDAPRTLETAGEQEIGQALKDYL